MNTQTNALQAQPEAPAKNGKRKKALLAVAGTVAVIGAVWGLYEWLVASHYESTDNAYVQGNLIQITPQIGGTVNAIYADETDFVKAGQPLVRLDPSDVNVALQQAEANLGQAVRQARTLYANNGTLAAQVKLREADAMKAEADLRRANDDLARRQSLSGNGAVSKEELNHAATQVANARGSVAAAQAGVAAAREQLASNRMLTDGTNVDLHPTVQAAAAKVREAWIAAQRASLPAPVDGYVAKRTAQLGQRIAAGTPVMTVVPLSQVWVDANFKEVQLRKIRIGQPVKLTADLYGKRVEYHGKVAGLGVGTGAAFALLPAQNATGNWIKVVQRVPVRVELDRKELDANPLRVGLSMDATVDVSQQGGKTLAEAPRGAAVAQMPVVESLDTGAENEVRRIIAMHTGRGTNMAGASAAQSPRAH